MKEKAGPWQVHEWQDHPSATSQSQETANHTTQNKMSEWSILPARLPLLDHGQHTPPGGGGAEWPVTNSTVVIGYHTQTSKNYPGSKIGTNSPPAAC